MTALLVEDPCEDDTCPSTGLVEVDTGGVSPDIVSFVGCLPLVLAAGVVVSTSDVWAVLPALRSVTLVEAVIVDVFIVSEDVTVGDSEWEVVFVDRLGTEDPVCSVLCNPVLG